MKVTNKQIMVHNFTQKAKLALEETAKYDPLFTQEKLFADPKKTGERGWIYANITNKDLSAFITIGYDDTQRALFHELRYKGKTYKVGDGFANESAKFADGKVAIKEESRELKWSGMPSEYVVEATFRKKGEKSEGELNFTYKFEKLSDELKKFKCVFKEFDHLLAYWMISPCKGSLEITGKGDISLFKLGELEELIGKNITSNFCYNENIHMRTPMISEGWHWSILDCFQDDEQKVEKFVSFMHFFFEKGKIKIPIYVQLIDFDPETGEAEVYEDAEIKLKWESPKTPLLSVKSKDGKIELKITPKYEIDVHPIRGIKLANMILKTDIDYSTYPCNAEVVIEGKKYNAIGSAEITGEGKMGYWL
ncbi:MAG: hypothetical protein AABX01_00770 [Candidatus Micrarchaeota archaeon]